MTKREIASLICKVLAVQTMIAAINQAPQIYLSCITMVVNNNVVTLTKIPDFTNYSIQLLMLPFLVSMLAGLYLWFRSDAIAGRMVRETATDTGTKTLVFAALGLFTLLHAVPSVLVSAAYYLCLTLRDSGTAAQVNRELIAERVQIFAGLGLGLWLFFGAAGVARLVERRAGNSG